MYTIVTVCPECKASQLADGKMIGKMVKCAKCERDFKCEKSLGPVLWVRPSGSNGRQPGFEKLATRVLFTYGIAVPVNCQEDFLNHLGVELSFGGHSDAIMMVGKRSFRVKIRYFKNKKGEPSLHFTWKASDAIGLELRAILPHVYEHFIVQGNKDYFVGGTVCVALGSKVGTFSMKMTDVTTDKPVQGNLFAPKKSGKVSLSGSLDDVGVKDLLSDLSI